MINPFAPSDPSVFYSARHSNGLCEHFQYNQSDEEVVYVTFRPFEKGIFEEINPNTSSGDEITFTVIEFMAADFPKFVKDKFAEHCSEL